MGPPIESDSSDGLKDLKGLQVSHLPFASSLWSFSDRNVHFSLTQQRKLGTKLVFGFSCITSHNVGPQINQRWTC